MYKTGLTWAKYTLKDSVETKLKKLIMGKCVLLNSVQECIEIGAWLLWPFSYVFTEN